MSLAPASAPPPDHPADEFCRLLSREETPAGQSPLPANRYVLRALALPGAARRLAKAAVHILGDMVSDKEFLYNLDLALSEACANVVRHAYRDRPEDARGDVEIVLAIERGSHVDVEVADWGAGFPSWPVTVKNALPEAEGGRGLFIMSRLADHFECRRGQGRNSVFLRMRIKEAAWIPSS